MESLSSPYGRFSEETVVAPPATMLLARMKAAFTTRKCCELSVLFSSIAVIWISFSLPILLYYVPKEEAKVRQVFIV